ncbi:hypothetical protein Desor_1787 [Desulfosporosinus orientis DSM 765]|uniref:Putative component of 'biosynthetic module' domain-containing protein n=1 Tax=Desulfosporosinus orientis (strain ATCC 19365 / DSM 765 / NCIMB 8382 / VKM B-1628 / Singapore I) TaxID=768706 RepID=G7W8J6_DESOD|nr:YceG family protein [Desulfosporosinus orientis]AET67423.1 hypothetical protein Desor_1787 [Desulfosporosinus orientis DSM 765]
MSDRGVNPYVYCYRVIGCRGDERYFADIAALDRQLKGLGNYTFFNKSIPVSTDAAVIQRIRKLLEPMPLKDFSNGALLNVLESHGYFSLSSDSQVNRKIKDAWGIILNLYVANEKGLNLSIIENFVTKLLIWFGDYGRQTPKQSGHNPKIIYWGSPGKHEVYFLILMSLLGWDVLVFNTSFKDKFNNIDKFNEYSRVIRYPQELPVGDFPRPSAKESLRPGQTPVQQGSRQPEPPRKVPEAVSSSLLSDEVVVVKLKRTENILQEILVPVKERSGFVGKPFPILPTFFVRYIGVPESLDDWEAEYFNNLYNMDKALAARGSYYKFETGIPAPSTRESSAIPDKFKRYSFQNHVEIIEQALLAQVLPRTGQALYDNTIRKAFADIVNLFVEKHENCSVSMVLNFALKMISWLGRYLPKLISRPILEHNYEENPKILFYGNIKAHEIYLLTFFYWLGGDVLFVHSDEEGDQPWQSFDEGSVLTHLVRNKHSLPLEAFPQGERLIRKSTIAYNASREIEEVIYSEDVGLFKPWQFESYGTQPITLKTTYDELKILWQEPAKLRPEFKVQNHKVYVPNLFAKINGAAEDLDDYWQDLKVLASAPNTKLIATLPFTEIRYTKQELYQTNYLLDKEGFVDEEKVVRDRHYKFGYLKASLQHFLIAKINELFRSGVFLKPVDDKLKLKILMTILTMDDDLLKLIEVFDYPQEIPKLIAYDNHKNTFNESDSILLAYFNLIGLDILVFTPTNYQTLEQFLKESLFDMHQLPLVKYDLLLPSLNNLSDHSTKLGLLSRFFKRH